MAIGSEGGGVRSTSVFNSVRRASARASRPDTGSRAMRSTELKRGKIDDDQRSQCNEQGPERVHRSIPLDVGGCRVTTIDPGTSSRHRPKVWICVRRMTYFVSGACSGSGSRAPGTGVSRKTGPRPRPSDGVPYRRIRPAMAALRSGRPAGSARTDGSLADRHVAGRIGLEVACPVGAQDRRPRRGASRPAPR